MSLLGNILWLIFGGGLIIFIQYALAGLACCITIVAIPFGIQCFKLAVLGLVPFGKEIEPPKNRSEGPLSLLANLIWLVFAGIWIALTHLGFALGCAITIIGIPFAVQHWKLAKLAVWPFGRDIR